MTDEQTVTVLRAAADAEVSDHHLDPGIAAAAWSAAQDRPRRLRLCVAAAATVVCVAGVSAALAVTQTNRPAGPSAGRPPATSACTGNVSTAMLPPWARSGFTSGGLPPRHIIGDHHEIVAVPFIELRVHQPRGTHNKILWVARHGTGPLHVSARLAGSSDTVTRTLPLGPSYVDMPTSGCWLLTLQWSGRRDMLALRYLP